MVIHEVEEDAESNAILPRQVVLYCEKCGMPPEYCEYGPDFETHCLPWLKKQHPETHAKLYGSKEVTVKPPKPSEPWTTEQRLTAFYEKYVPEKIESIPGLLEKYAGKEENLFSALVKKYGPEPEDPFDADSDDEEDSEDDEEDDEDAIVPGRKRRGVKAKSSETSALRIVIQKQTQKRKKFMTIVHGMETVPNVKLKDVSKTFSKKFAGSSSVKDKSIIVQGDHVYDAAELIVDQFQVPGECVFLEIDGEIHPLK
jgi:density-regulated protein DRP1